MFVSEGDLIYVTPQDANQLRFLECIMGGSYSKPKNRVKFPRTMGVMLELHDKVPDLRTNPEFMETGRKLYNEREAMLQARKAEVKQSPDDPLRPYQRADVEIGKSLDALGIFNDPRSGKTPTALVTIKEKGTLLNLIIVPASLLYTWEKQIKTWVPESKVLVIDGTGKKDNADVKVRDFTRMMRNAKQHFIIISKNSVGKLQELYNLTFDMVLVDEAHFLRNYNTAQSKNIFKLKRREAMALTGTPTVSHPSDVYGILHFLKPKAFSSFWGFANRYFDTSFNTFSGHEEVSRLKPERERELQELTGLYSVARKRKDVMPWIPAKERQTLYAKMTPTQTKHYKEMADIFFTECQETGAELDAANIVSQLMRLRQLVLDPRMCGLKTRGAKTDILLNWLKERDEKTPVVIMSMFTSYYDFLEEDLVKEGYAVARITGKQTNKQKQEAADAFQAGKVDILLCNIISAGTGWTLDRADTVIFMDNAWNPSDNEQAEDRVCPTTESNIHGHRILQITVEGTVDDRMFKILERKQDLTQIINHNAQQAVEDLMKGWGI